ncbi:MAG: hypothetical protein ACJ8H8_02375 [Geminicoccaceae bacterium]
MTERETRPLHLVELDVMIARAEAMCERYQQAAEVGGLSRSRATKRRSGLQTMRTLLARLQAQRAAAERRTRADAG